MTSGETYLCCQKCRHNVVWLQSEYKYSVWLNHLCLNVLSFWVRFLTVISNKCDLHGNARTTRDVIWMTLGIFHNHYRECVSQGSSQLGNAKWFLWWPPKWEIRLVKRCFLNIFKIIVILAVTRSFSLLTNKCHIYLKGARAPSYINQSLLFKGLIVSPSSLISCPVCWFCQFGLRQLNLCEN